MIDKNAEPEAWAMFATELEDAADALAALLREIERDGYGDPELRIGLGHVYAHLNRAWHSRDASASAALDPTDEQHEAWSQFPDLHFQGTRRR